MRLGVQDQNVYKREPLVGGTSQRKRGCEEEDGGEAQAAWPHQAQGGPGQDEQVN